MSEPARSRPSAAIADHVSQALADLRQHQEQHPLWDCALLRDCAAGVLTAEDLRFVFGQYYLYSKNFTRYLAALMVNCESDLYRSRLSQNLWDEGGGADPEQRHAQLFRDFLRDGLGLPELEAIQHGDSTRHFAAEYLAFCRHESPAAACAFLSLGTEAIVRRLYGIFVAGLRQAGIADRHLTFFHVHIAGDDDHAATLEEMLGSYATDSAFFDTSMRALDRALTLRLRFFDNLHESLRQRRVSGLIDRIQARASLLPELPAGSPLHARPAQEGVPLYANDNERLNIRFAVDRLPFRSEVLDGRVVRIAAGKCNERHRHAHETLYYVISGRGTVTIDEVVLEVGPGDTAFVPRWAFHQTQSLGEPVVLLAVTDFGLTGRAFIGDYDRTARLVPPEPRF